MRLENRMGRIALALATVAVSGILSGSFAHAQVNADGRTRDMLIQKLTQVYLNLAPSDSSKVAITLRLADLHAERARVESMKELSDGCTVCNAGKDDRKKALTYYQEVLPKVAEGSVGKVLAQVGHLFEMTGNQKDAIATYTRILKENKSPEAVAEAHLSLAEVYFKMHDYPQAREQYSAVLNNPAAASRGLAAYRIAWCDFNAGQLNPAIDGLVKILKSPELLSRSSSAGVVQVDKQFQEEVSRDLATFLARRPVTVQDAQLVYETSPDSAKIANVTYLAGEVERLGQVPAAINLWRFVQEKQSKPQARMEGHVRLAQLEMEQKLLPAAVKDFESALALWSTLGTCDNGECSELKSRLRKFVTDWNRVEKKNPSEQLLSAYVSYLKVFPDEGDMAIWAAKVAQDTKQYAVSTELNQRAAKLSQATLTDPKADKDAKKDASARLEAALLGAIESAELSKEPKLLDAAYDSYLSLSRERKQALEVQYQKAHLIYDRKEYGAAADALREVALSKEKGGAAALKKQAADLSLDALVLAKDDQKLESWSADYAKTFPTDSKEFAAIARKSVLTQSAAAAQAGGNSGLEEAWKVLNRFDVSNASAEDKAAYYKNKLILAEKLGRFTDGRDAVENMLRQPGLSAADQQYALSRKAWLAEMVLDFDTALNATEKLSGSELPNGQKWLKLAMYADLASKDAKPYYSQYLKESKDDDKNLAIAMQLVRESKEPAKEMDKNKAILAKHPESIGQLYLDQYAKTGAIETARKGLAQPGVAPTAPGKVLARMILLDDYAKLKTKISAHQLDGSNQKKMAATLKGRVALLDEVEKLASKAIESGDWTAQLVTLDLLSKQSERFYQEVLGLPVPAGLSSEDEQQYLSLLSQQAAPHQLRANDTAKKVSEFWANDAVLAKLDEALAKENGPQRAILLKEVKVLSDVAPDAKKAQLTAMVEKKEPSRETPNLASIEKARQAVRENPMNRERIEDLLSLERKMNRPAMVGYLEGRLATLDNPAKTVN